MNETLQLCWHITRRNWMVYRKDFIANISPTISDPLFFLLSLGLGLGALITTVDGKTYAQFLAPGLAVSTALLTSFFETSYGFYVRMTFENVFKAMLTTPIGVHEVILGEFLWVAIKGAFMTLGTSLVLLAFGLITNPWLIPFMTLVGVLVALSCGAMGLIATSFVRNINQFQTVYSFFISPLFFFSGIFYPLWEMPVPLQWAAKALPLAHGVIMAQNIFWDQSISSTFVQSAFILTLQSAFFCIWAYVATTKKLRQ